MILAYEASDNLEAHMILNLFEQSGIKGRIDGEYLQGGVGELQPAGFIRVLVPKENFEEARAIITDWDSQSPEVKQTDSQSSKPSKSSNIRAMMVSFFSGILIMAIYFNTPIEIDGIDYNGDGILDEKWTIVNYRMSKTELDSNLDGDTDIILHYDRLGILLTSESDENFDGIFETEYYYKNGNAIWSKSDTTGDGYKDYRSNFKFGLLDKVSFFNPDSNQTIKLQHYTMSKLTSAEMDTNGDGKLDTQIKYDSIEEVESINHKYNNKVHH